MSTTAFVSNKTKSNSLFDDSLQELLRQLNPNASDKRREERLESGDRTVDRLSLATFVEKTANFTLEDWQLHLCRRLEKLTYQKGQRILIHKPPQHGGSVIVSQRLPAYLIGDNPITRVKLACYNIEHATAFTGINKSIMLTSEYKAMFEDDEGDLEIPTRAPDKGFYTRARKSVRDGQPSLAALGLLTGFVGQGADTLIIDDPYASPQDAASPTICKSVWTFWVAGAKVRIDENCNVVVMFHRYHEDDFVGQMIQEEGLQSQGGKWELLSYRAEWDDDIRLEVGGEDPLRRKKGEYLSPRKASQPGYYPEQKKNPSIWLSQFQGKPSREEGNMFKVNKFRVIAKVPCNLIRVCRAFDTASTADAGDWTVGVKMGLGEDDYVYVLDVVRFRKDTSERNAEIRRVTRVDNQMHKNTDFITVMPQDPSGAGKDQALSFTKLLVGFPMKIVTSFNRGNKEVRADPYSDYVNSGLVRLVYFGDIFEKDSDGEYVSWIPAFVAEHRVFPGSKTDDQIDASADAFSEIALGLDNPAGDSFDTMGFSEEESKSLDLNLTNPDDEEYENYLGLFDIDFDNTGINYGTNKNEFQASKETKPVSRYGTSAERKVEQASKRRCKVHKSTNKY